MKKSNQRTMEQTIKIVKKMLVSVDCVGTCMCYVYNDNTMSYNSVDESVRFFPEEPEDKLNYDLVKNCGE